MHGMHNSVAIADTIRSVLTRLGLARAVSRRAYGALPSGSADAIASANGGNIQPIARTQTRWYIDDIESATLECDQGRLRTAAQLMRAASSDGVIMGLMSTRTAGLVRLPKRWRGDSKIISALTGGDLRARTVFSEMCPDSELALLAADGDKLGVAVGQMLAVDGRSHKRLCRLEPEYLVFNWSENQWYYQSVGGMLPVTPGDGTWVLHIPGGEMAPWNHGLWRALGRAFIRKDHAALSKDLWEAKLAHPARVAVAPVGASQEQSLSWFQQVMAWGKNTVFAFTPGYDVKLIESNGRGADSFRETIAEQNREIMILIAGQTVTTDGGTGFANADIHKSIRSDIIETTASALAYTVNTQILPAWVLGEFGEDALLAGGVVVEWDVTPPKDRNSEATALVTTANAIKLLTESLAPHGVSVDVGALCDRFAVPVSAVTPSADVLASVAQAEPQQQEATWN